MQVLLLYQRAGAFTDRLEVEEKSSFFRGGVRSKAHFGKKEAA
jgi:hypothetical protein